MWEKQLNHFIAGCRRADRSSQRKVYEHFYADVFGVCLRYASSKAEAAELANDAFFKAFTQIDKFEQGSNFGGWLYTIARRTAIDRYRVSIRQPMAVELNMLTHQPVGSPEVQILSRIDAEEKLRLVQLLPPAYRTVFNLYVVEEMTHEEIGAELGISVGASKSNLSKARMKLRELIEKHYTTSNAYGQ